MLLDILLACQTDGVDLEAYFPRLPEKVSRLLVDRMWRGLSEQWERKGRTRVVARVVDAGLGGVGGVGVGGGDTAVEVNRDSLS